MVRGRAPKSKVTTTRGLAADAKHLSQLTCASMARLRQLNGTLAGRERDRVLRAKGHLEKAREVRRWLSSLGKQQYRWRTEAEEATGLLRSLLGLVDEYVGDVMAVSTSVEHNTRMMQEAADFAMTVEQRLASSTTAKEASRLTAPFANSRSQPAAPATAGTCWMHSTLDSWMPRQ